MTKASTIIMGVAIVILAVALVSATVYVVFEKPQKGKYSGPGAPIAKSYDISVGTNDSYCALPIFVNYSSTYYINETVVSTSDSGSTTGLIVMLMNQTDYNYLKDNVTLKSLISNNLKIEYKGFGVSQYYFVILNELSSPVTVQGTIQVNLEL